MDIMEIDFKVKFQQKTIYCSRHYLFLWIDDVF